MLEVLALLLLFLAHAAWVRRATRAREHARLEAARARAVEPGPAPAFTPSVAPTVEDEAAPEAPLDVADDAAPPTPTAAIVLVPYAKPTRAAPLPVVFVHGFAGFGELRAGRLREAYFRGVAPRLAAKGVDARFVTVPPLAAIEVRARALVRALGAMRVERVHLVAHSMGGLDARWAITHLGLDRQVASLVTVGTPHRGTPLADVGARLLGRRARVPALGAVHDLTRARMDTLNDVAPDSHRVRYASVTVAPQRGVRGISPALVPTYLLLAGLAGPNDGVVPTSSQRWGDDWGTVDTDHWGAVGWSVGGSRFDAPTFYEGLVDRLLDPTA